jgi:dynein heavy chain
MGGKNRSALTEFVTFSNLQLENMIGLVRGTLTKNQRNTMGALIVLDVHAIEVVKRLVKERVDDINNFSW